MFQGLLRPHKPPLALMITMEVYIYYGQSNYLEKEAMNHQLITVMKVKVMMIVVFPIYHPMTKKKNKTICMWNY